MRFETCKARRAALVLLAAALAGCSDVPVEEIEDFLPDPSAVLEGGVLYAGPRPACEYDASGAPTRIAGVLVMTLIDDAKPLPPEGTNQQPASFLAVDGSTLFTLADCRPADPALFDPSDTIMRGVDFRWPQVPLAENAGESIAYRVTAFYDQRGDFSPFFTVQSATTKGDVAGAAIVGATDPSFDLVTVGNIVESPLGETIPGIAVTVGGYVRTEPPMFRVEDGELDAALPVPAAVGGPQVQSALLATSAFTLRMFGRDLPAGDAADQDLERVLDVLRPDGDPDAPRLLDPDLDDPVAYAWYHQGLDFDRNGIADEHPVLGPMRQKVDGDEASGDTFRLETPVVLLQRLRSPEEVRAGVPDVGLQAASPNRDHGAFPDLPRVEYPTTEVIVPPIAAVLLNPALAVCAVPYMPPGSPREYYEENPENPSPVECHEIPTGAYGVNVMQGMVGGAVVADADSETGSAIDGGEFAGQIWSVPNALGDLEQIGDLLPPEMQTPVVSQSPAGALRFVDSTPAGPTGRHEQLDHCTSTPLNPFHTGGIGVPWFKEFPYAGECEAGQPSVENLCCASVRHLCSVPRCPYDACDPGVISSPREGMGETRSFSYTNRCGEAVTETAYFPECIPFYLPEVCCDDLWGEDGAGMPAPITEPFVDPSTCT